MHVLYQIYGDAEQIKTAESSILRMATDKAFSNLSVEIQTSLILKDIPQAFRLVVEVPKALEADQDALKQFRAFVEEIHHLDVRIIDLLERSGEV